MKNGHSIEMNTSENCNENESTNLMSESEQCNIEACDPDQLATMVDCKDTEYGCCPTDNSTPADEDFSNCPMITVESMESCLQSEYGCCPIENPDDNTDELENNLKNLTLALGPYGLGYDPSSCEMVTTPANLVKDCSRSKFGCCPDGWNEAQGPNGEGCEEGSGDISAFLASTINTVMNLFVTTEAPVTGDDIDCSLTEFGCCPNGKTKATGPRYYGCTCHDYPFGCCQDGYSPASGENLEGCLCERMLYGCCADGRTPAKGENREGCDCTSSPYGCCSDMFTFAQGPNYQGCPCDTLTYGCCPGSQIPARGPDFTGCSCADTPFGCCGDGITVAYGPKFEGCPTGLPLDMKLNSEVCKLPKETGPCSNFSVQWFFDNESGRCNRFWYGG
ncbi:hypothetical protein BLA29_005219, partial [Euroglyphus maynei]